MYILLLLAGLIGLLFFMQCPSPTPPPGGVLADISAMWGTLIFLACGLYAVIPFRAFQIASFTLAILAGVGFVLIFTLSGSGAHALFLMITLAIGIFYGVVFNYLATVTLELVEWPRILKWIAALFIAYFAQFWACVRRPGSAPVSADRPDGSDKSATQPARS